MVGPDISSIKLSLEQDERNINANTARYNRVMLKFIFLLLVSLPIFAESNNNNLSFEDEFANFITEFKTTARNEGISEKVINLVLDSSSFNPEVIRFDRTQAEFTQTFWNYLDKRVSRYRIDEGEQCSPGISWESNELLFALHLHVGVYRFISWNEIY